MSVYIDGFRLKTIPMLPTVYDESLSYMETLGRLTHKVNEVISAVNGFENDVLEKANAYTDVKIAAEIEALQSDLEAFKDDLTAQQEGFEQNVNGAIENMNQRIARFNETIQANYTAMQAYTTNAIAQNNLLIFEKIEEGLVDVRVINIFTGEKVTVQEMFNYLANFHLTNAITLARIAGLQRTVNTVISYGTSQHYTCTDIVTNGYTVFGN